MQTHEGERLYVCDECNYVAIRKDHLKMHERTHTGEKPYKCNECDYAATQKHHLKMHKRTHTGEKPYECDTCGNAFADKGTLTRHTRVHTGERPYSCNACDFAAADKNALKVHNQAHTGGKPYVCNVCDYAAARKVTLTLHMRTHTGEKPYACDICDYTAISKDSVAKHMWIHTGEKPYACDHCDYTATRSSHIARHIICQHTGHKCVTCKRFWVKEETMICGFCAMGSTYGEKERTVFAALCEADERFDHIVRDTAIGCGSKRRPDGHLTLPIPCGGGVVMLIIEVDENQHRRYEPSCEFERLQDIQDVHKGSLYVVRYNPDQKQGLDEEKLAEFADHLIAILEGGYKKAVNTFGGLWCEYHGYTDKRIETLDRAWFESQIIKPD